jgi:phosphoribosylformylglycinamidine (FGAM) synthase-like enzyme
MTLKIPTVHLNGTSKRALIDGYADAALAIDEAARKLAAAAPNGRDYYVQEPGAINIAMDQHEARMRKLREVRDELEAIAIEIQNAGR